MAFDKSSQFLRGEFNGTAETAVMFVRYSLQASPGVVLLGAALLGGHASAQGSTSSTPLTLEAALTRLTNAPSVTQAALSVQVAQQNLQAARAALGLTVSVTGNATYASSAANDATNANASGSSLSGSAGVNASLGLLPWSNAQTSLRTAERNLALAQARLTATQNTARLNVAQQYLNAVIAAQDVTLAGKTLTLRQRQLAVQQTQQQNGNATAQDVLTAQANVQAAQGAQVQAQASLDNARRGLSAALGSDALGSDLSNLTLTSTPSESFTLPELTPLVMQARTARSEVIDAQNTLLAAQDALAAQQRDAKLPDLTASVRYGPAGSGGLNANLNVKQGTLGAGYTVPFGGSSSDTNRLSASISGSFVVYSPALQAQVTAAQASVTQAQLSLSVAQQNAELDVRSKYAAAQSAVLNVQTAVTQVQVAQLGLDTARTRLQAGTATQDDVTQAELNLEQAGRNVLNARAQAQIAVLQLLNAAGGNA